MSRIAFVSRLAPVLALALVLAACGGGDKKPDQGGGGMPQGEIPPWAMNGTSKVSTEGGRRVFQGVGIITGVRNRGLAIGGAGQKARTEIARMLNTYVQDLMKMYQRSTTAGDMSASSEEQDIMNATKTYTESAVSGAQITKTFCDAVNPPTCYALAELDLDAFKGMIDAPSKELSPKVRDSVRANADKAFEDLDSESAKPHDK